MDTFRSLIAQILRNVLAYVFGLVLGGWSVYSMAETMPATYGGRVEILGSFEPIAKAAHPNARGIYAYVGSGRFEYYTQASGSDTTSKSSGMTCGGSFGFVWPWDIKCTYPAAYYCPSGQGWTLSGQTCTRPDCAPGETRDASGVCQAPACIEGSSLLNGECVSDTCPDGSPRALGGLCRGKGVCRILCKRTDGRKLPNCPEPQ